MNNIEKVLDSREVTEMVGKEHGKLIRDIRRYTNQFNEANIGLVEYFRESTYQDSKGETCPCYQITKKGCEFIAHKLTGTKGTEFTYKFIERFHEMEEIIQETPAIQTTSQELLAKALMEASTIISAKDKELQEKDNELTKMQQQQIMARTGCGVESYREMTRDYLTKINDKRRLSQIYTISKRLYEYETGKRSIVTI